MRAALAVLPLCALALPAAAQTGPLCGPRAGLVKVLAERYAETARGMGLTSTGQMIELYASEAGTWTVLLTKPDGVACLMASGSSWEGAVAKAGDPA